MSDKFPLFDFLQDKGQPVLIKRNYRFFLQDAPCVYYLEKGDIDLFAIELEQEWNTEQLVPKLVQQTSTFIGDFMGGSLHYLCGHTAPTLLFPFPLEKNLHVIGRANTPTHIRKVPVEDLFPFLKSDFSSELHFDTLFLAWLRAFNRFYATHYIQRIDHYLQIGTEQILKKGETVALPHFHEVEMETPLAWLKFENTVQLFDIDASTLDSTSPPFPLISGLWLKATTEGKVISEIDKRWGAQPQLWQGVLLFNTLLLRGIKQLVEFQKKKERGELTLRKTTENRLFDEVITSFYQVFKKGEYFPPPLSEDQLTHACEIAAHAMQLKIKSVPQFHAHTPLGKVQEICLESSIYNRTLRLTKGWWKNAGGTFIGFDEIDKKGVALLQNKHGGYSLINPSEKLKPQTVDNKVAEKLSLFAVMFYRALPFKKILTGWDIFAFCLDGHLKIVLHIFFLSLFATLLTFFIPFGTELIFDNVIPLHDYPLYWQILLGMGVVILGASFFNLLREYAIVRLFGFFLHDLTTGLWQRLLYLPTNFFRHFSVGNLLGRIDGIIEAGRLLSTHTIKILLNLFFSSLYLLVMLYYSPFLTLIIFVIVIFFLGINFFILYRTNYLENRIQEISANLDGKSIEVTLGISQIRTAGAEKRIFSWWTKNFADLKRKEYERGNLRLIVKSLNGALFALGTLAIFWGYLAMVNDPFEAISLGSFLAFYSVFTLFTMALVDFGERTLELTPIYSLYQRSKVILEEEMEYKEGKHLTESLEGKVRVEHAFFRYSENATYNLQDVTIHAEPGEFVAIVGPTGSGKSTLLRLLLGFEKPEQGVIYFDGKDLSQINAQEVRRQIGVILQTSNLLEGSIKENVARGRFVTEKEILEALDMANFTEDLMGLEMGIETVLTNFGGSLSGGQKQRILLASAFVGRPRILLMDEATNALDSISQAKITHALSHLNITRIVIAHRLSTIAQADRIYVLDKGVIVQQGTYEELLATPGLFAQFAKRQNIS